MTMTIMNYFIIKHLFFSLLIHSTFLFNLTRIKTIKKKVSNYIFVMALLEVI
jgi:hypothetical protein